MRGNESITELQEWYQERLKGGWDPKVIRWVFEQDLMDIWWDTPNPNINIRDWKEGIKTGRKQRGWTQRIHPRLRRHDA